MDINAIITFIACIVFLFIFGRILILPLKNILKLVFNSIIGGALIFLINLVGSGFGFSIGINIWTSMFVGLLGIPGAVLLIILKIFIGS